MFDKDVNNSIRKGIKIGKWFFIGSSVTSLIIWTLLGFLAYKFIWVDMIASKYSNTNGENKATYIRWNKVRNIENMYSKYVYNSFDYWHSKEFKQLGKKLESYLPKDDLGLPIFKGTYCRSISTEMVDKYASIIDITDDEIERTLLNNIHAKDIRSPIKFLNYDIAQVYFDKNKCSNVESQAVAKKIGDKYILGKFDLFIGQNSYAPSFTVKMHRFSDDYKIINESSKFVTYYNIKNGNYIHIASHGRVSIYKKEYIDDVFNFGKDFYKDVRAYTLAPNDFPEYVYKDYITKKQIQDEIKLFRHVLKSSGSYKSFMKQTKNDSEERSGDYNNKVHNARWNEVKNLQYLVKHLKPNPSILNGMAYSIQIKWNGYAVDHFGNRVK